MPLLLALALLLPGALKAQGVSDFIAVDAPVVALRNAILIDGTGVPARSGQTVVLRDGMISAVGPDGEIEVPADAEVHDLTGMTLLPGLVMLHEHMFYPAGGGGMYNEMGWSFPRLYLAGGVTTARTGGSMMPYADLNLRDLIAAGRIPGPRLDVTGPYLNGPGLPIPGVHALSGPDDARRMVDCWADEGVDSFKAYMQISRAELGAAIEEAHARGIKVTGHLCSVTYREAADLGIDNLEHGFMAATDFVADKEPDRCPSGASDALVGLDPHGPEFRALVDHLVEHGVAITTTMPVFETSVPGRPPASPGALDAMSVEARESYLRRRARLAVADSPETVALFERAMQMEKVFHDAGGLLIAGTDPTGYGGVVAGYANQRQLMLLVEGGFTPEEAVMIASLNGARYLEMADEIGTVEAGKRADLVVVRGNVSEDISAVRNMVRVFKDGVGWDSAALFASVRGTVGIR